MISRPAAWNWIITSRTDFKEWKVLAFGVWFVFVWAKVLLFFLPLRPLLSHSPWISLKKTVTHKKSALNLYSPRENPSFASFFFFLAGKRVGWKRCMMCDVFDFALGGWDVSFAGSTLSYLHTVLLAEEIRQTHQLRLVVYPSIYRDLHIPGGCLGFLPSTIAIPSPPFKSGWPRWPEWAIVMQNPFCVCQMML